jgi:hypothetical protein
MTPAHLSYFRGIWGVDFEFQALDGERPSPICMVAREMRSGRTIRLWEDELRRLRTAPYPVDRSCLFVAYYASAEMSCHLALQWPMSVYVLDLYAEFRALTNGLSIPCGNGLLGALAYFGIDGMDVTEKEDMRRLALRGGPWASEERQALHDYCESDVVVLERLLRVMSQRLDLPRALLRGRYMKAAAHMEWNGVPIDIEALALIRDNWEQIKAQLIAEIDREYGVFLPTGQRAIDPNTRLGAVLLETAAEWQISPYQLAQAVDQVWQEERALYAESIKARRQARQTTGLTAARINRWENSGRDYSSWPGLDDMAQELAGILPDLGIGPGYSNVGYDDTDYAAHLWELLRDHDERAKPKHDPSILSRAADLVASYPDEDWRYGGPLTFSAQCFTEYLNRTGIPWPRLDSGALALDDETFREMARAYPTVIGPLRELRHSLSQLRLSALTVGGDGRNRCLLSAFRARTGRNQPSNTHFIFGPAVWLRFLILPEPGMGVAYIDWSQQEFGIAAVLSGDQVMIDAYQSGDPYLAFAKQAGAVPPEGTKAIYGAIREQYKACALAVQYGMGEASLAVRTGQTKLEARILLQRHRETYPTFWRWSDSAVDYAMIYGRLHTVFGWPIHIGCASNPRSLRNFPMQANGAEMLRLACCLATERGIHVCAPVHDALLIEASLDELDQAVAETQRAMAKASAVVLNGFELRSDAKVFRSPERYRDERGEKMWNIVQELIGKYVTELVDF